MKILLTNDDGINSIGLQQAEQCLQNFGEVMVVAPDRERSGSGCSSSIYQTLRCRKISSDRNHYRYALSGTPVDCIMVALEKLVRNNKPNLIISGINAGANLGRDIFYSGTVGAAIEGAFQSILSMSISIDQKENSVFSTAIKVMEKIIKELPLESHLPSKMLNINIPNVEYSEIKGFCLTELAHIYHQKYIKNVYRTENTQYFWIGGSEPRGMMEENSDYWAVKNNFVSLTAVSLELKQKVSEPPLKDWIERLNRP